jgi:hypothetical protein
LSAGTALNAPQPIFDPYDRKVSAGWQAAAHPALSDMASVEP